MTLTQASGTSAPRALALRRERISLKTTKATAARPSSRVRLL